MTAMSTLFHSALLCLASACAAAEIGRSGPSLDLSHGPLRVDADHRGLEFTDGTPFLWLGDTAWELFHRTDRAEAERYLEKRRSQGFTVIQAVALAEANGLNAPNSYGSRPFVDNDPSRPATTPGNDPGMPGEYDYWDHVDYVFELAAAKGLVVAFLPTWGDKIASEFNWGSGPQVLNQDNSRAYGRWLAQRYSSRPNLIWVLGGDRQGADNLAAWREMAAGIQEIDAGRHLMTFHPLGGCSSRMWFENDPWHAFSMIQTGHGKNTDVWNRIEYDWRDVPTMPALNAESTYEDHAYNHDVTQGFADDYDVRKNLYWSMLAGAFGHTYGCYPNWQFYAPGRDSFGHTQRYWTEGLDLPGAWDIQHARTLLEARPMATRRPDLALLASNSFGGGDHIVGARAKDNAYALVYSASGREFTVNLARLDCPRVKAWWYDPREGTSTSAGEYLRPAGGGFTAQFTPPSTGKDWLLVLDDAARGFASPGRLIP